MANLIAGGCQGPLSPVNPKAEVVWWLRPLATATTLQLMCRRSRWLARLPAKLPALRVHKAVDSKLLATDQREWLPAATTDAILQTYGTPFALSRRITNPGDAGAAAHELGCPVVLKAEAVGLLRECEPRAVRTGLRSGDEVSAASDLQRRLGKKFGEFTLQVQAHAEGHREVLLGRFRSAPAADLDTAYDALLRLQRFVTDVPKITEVEVNSFILAKKGASSVAVDGRMRVEF